MLFTHMCLCHQAV